jgi:hypothetical protein
MKRCGLLQNAEADPVQIRFGADRSNARACGITPP